MCRGNITLKVRRDLARSEKNMMVVDRIALALIVIGALVWGGIGIFGFNLVAWLFGSNVAIVSRIIYTLVGLAGVWSLSLLFRSWDSEPENVR